MFSYLYIRSRQRSCIWQETFMYPIGNIYALDRKYFMRLIQKQNMHLIENTKFNVSDRKYFYNHFRISYTFMHLIWNGVHESAGCTAELVLWYEHTHGITEYFVWRQNRNYDAMPLFTEFWTSRVSDDHTYFGRSRWVSCSQVWFVKAKVYRIFE